MSTQGSRISSSSKLKAITYRLIFKIWAEQNHLRVPFSSCSDWGMVPCVRVAVPVIEIQTKKALLWHFAVLEMCGDLMWLCLNISAACPWPENPGYFCWCVNRLTEWGKRPKDCGPLHHPPRCKQKVCGQKELGKQLTPCCTGHVNQPRRKNPSKAYGRDKQKSEKAPRPSQVTWSPPPWRIWHLSKKNSSPHPAVATPPPPNHVLMPPFALLLCHPINHY